MSPNGNSAGEVSEPSLRIVVADGASESLLAGRWARWLAENFGTATSSTKSRLGFLNAYRAAAAAWADEVERYVEERYKRGVPIQWYEEPGLAQGAYSTVLAMEVTRNSGEHGRWRATALGDSCVFHVRDDCVRRSFPLEDAEAFSNQPPLLPSRVAEDETVRRNVSLGSGTWEPGDSFYLVTDALAAWFLRVSGSGGRPWEELRDIDVADAEPDFSVWVDRKRDEGELRNDDTTLVRITLY